MIGQWEVVLTSSVSGIVSLTVEAGSEAEAQLIGANWHTENCKGEKLGTVIARPATMTDVKYTQRPSGMITTEKTWS